MWRLLFSTVMLAAASLCQPRASAQDPPWALARGWPANLTCLAPPARLTRKRLISALLEYWMASSISFRFRAI